MVSECGALTLATTNLRRGRNGGFEVVGLPVEAAGLPLRPLCSMASGYVIAACGPELWALRAEVGAVGVMGGLGAVGGLGVMGNLGDLGEEGAQSSQSTLSTLNSLSSRSTLSSQSTQSTLSNLRTRSSQSTRRALSFLSALGEGTEVYCAVTGGDRAIVMTSAGAHHVVMRGGEPVSLGTLPELPPVELTLEGVATLTESTPALTLTDVSALREGTLSAADAATLKEHLMAAWQRIVSRANTLGACVMPAGITVTAEVRQLDSAGAATGSRGRMAVGGGSGVATAYASVTDGGMLAPVTLSVKVMKMRVDIGARDAEADATWGAGASGVEVALSAAPAVAASWRMRVEHPASGEARVAVITDLDARSAAQDAPLQSVLRADAGTPLSTLVEIPATVIAAVGEVVAGTGFIARAGAVSGDVVLWADIDGRCGEVGVASAASPLSLTSRATLSLASIAAVEAAPRLGSAALSPGCAHFYAFTADGTLSLAVGARRGAPTASLLDRRPVSRREAVTATPEHVAALTDYGDEIVILRGGRASTLLRSPALAGAALGYEPRSGELYVVNSQGEVRAVALREGSSGSNGRFGSDGNYGRDGSERRMPFAVESIATCGHTLWLTSSDGLYDASRSDSQELTPIEWRVRPDADGPVALRSVTLGLRGRFNGTFAIAPAGFADIGLTVAPMWSVAIAGDFRSPLAFILPLPPRGTAVASLAGFAAPGTQLTDISFTYKRKT